VNYVLLYRLSNVIETGIQIMINQIVIYMYFIVVFKTIY
jgi:hypothetical protein